MAMSEEGPSTVLEIHTCTQCMAQSGKKETSYFAGIINPQQKALGSYKCRTNLVMFDGTGNIYES